VAVPKSSTQRDPARHMARPMLACGIASAPSSSLRAPSASYMLVVTKIDRLARSVGDLCAIVGKIEAKGASLRILAMNLDTATPTGKLMLNVLGSVAQFEREVMLERQREAIAKAKADGKYRGRAPTARAKATEVRKLIEEA
jgi:DNA invertase Pin-like site-specific DNA recombinase